MFSYRFVALAVALFPAGSVRISAGQSFVNFETPHVHPVDITADGTRLVAVNTPDNRVEVFDISLGDAVPIFSVPVGLDPVSVRARGDDEIWVVNHVSDSISVIDLALREVVATIATDDEPCDVVFAGEPGRAFVSCSQVNRVQVFDPSDLSLPPSVVEIAGEDPRAMAVSADGMTVLVAVFESGNGTTILGGGLLIGGGFPPNVVNENSGPYGGVNPPPNDGGSFVPAQNPGNPSPPGVGLIVRKDSSGAWKDDNNGNWTAFVSGANAAMSGRPVGWDLLDHDVAMIDASSLAVTYATRLMNICMALAVNPGTEEVVVLGTDAINEVRYEPNLVGRFLRVNSGRFLPSSPGSVVVADLNDHLTYTSSTVPQGERNLSVGDPRGIVWNSAGTLGYVSGMGSNNVILIDQSASRVSGSDPIVVGEGPTGLALDESRDRLYVLNKFSSTVSVVDTLTHTVVSTVSMHDPSPSAIKLGRRHLYNTQATSGLGHVSCGSCHVDGRMDRLAWDLGDPAGDMKVFNQNCGNGLDGNCQDWHPMKGPMTTQTLQDIIGKEPHHWRGDRNGLEEFNLAFVGLLGDDEILTNGEMQEFEDFLSTIHFPPNPFRNVDNSLPADLDLTGHYTTGRFGAAGQPLPNGNAVTGLSLYRTGGLDAVECVTCHTLPVGIGSNYVLQGAFFTPMPPGPDGELHHSIVSVDGSTNVSIKTPQLRNMHEKSGFDLTQLTNTAGFGFLHDGSVDSIARFVSEPVFSVSSDQEVADLVAFMLSFAGSDLPLGSASDPLELPGPLSQDAHAAVGVQVTIAGPGVVGSAVVDDMIALAEAGAIGLVVKGEVDGVPRGYVYEQGGVFQSDRQSESLSAAGLSSLSDLGVALTYTVVPAGSEVRIGVDRDGDGFLDRDEWDACSGVADASSVPSGGVIDGDFDGNGLVDSTDLAYFSACYFADGDFITDECRCTFDFDESGVVDCTDFEVFEGSWSEPGDPPFFAACEGAQIPAVGTWGGIVLFLLLMVLGSVLYGGEGWHLRVHG